MLSSDNKVFQDTFWILMISNRIYVDQMMLFKMTDEVLQNPRQMF